MLHCMIDVETLGRRHDAAIIQIGWCLFTADKILSATRRNVHLSSAMKYGTICSETLMWWMKQSEEARKSAFTSQPEETLEEALFDLMGSIQVFKPDHFWAHATFDFPILTNAFNAINKNPPWHFRATRDLRTLDMLANAATIENWPVREGTYHDAMDDAVHQAKCAQLMLKKLNWKPE